MDTRSTPDPKTMSGGSSEKPQETPSNSTNDNKSSRPDDLTIANMSISSPSTSEPSNPNQQTQQDQTSPTAEGPPIEASPITPTLCLKYSTPDTYNSDSTTGIGNLLTILRIDVCNYDPSVGQIAGCVPIHPNQKFGDAQQKGQVWWHEDSMQWLAWSDTPAEVGVAEGHVIYVFRVSEPMDMSRFRVPRHGQGYSDYSRHRQRYSEY